MKTEDILSSPNPSSKRDTSSCTGLAESEKVEASSLEGKTILVSACLLGEKCRYDGISCRDEAVIALGKRNTLIPVCPECLSGLPTPRKPVEILEDRVRTKDGDDLTGTMEGGIDKAMEIVKEKQPDLAILMERSPSCGSSIIYDGTFSSRLIPGKGLFTRKLEKEGIQVVGNHALQGC